MLIWIKSLWPWVCGAMAHVDARGSRCERYNGGVTTTGSIVPEQVVQLARLIRNAALQDAS